MEIETKAPDCKYNRMLECPPGAHKCNRCGWNPKVMKERLQKFYNPAKEEEK